MTEEILHHFDNHTFNKKLIHWYNENKRDLPWRQTNNPYYIWISEIMLQQTKVDTVIHYYKNFITTFPTIFDLAKADEQTVLKLWEGLGYYSRARNLHTAAKDVVARYNGKVPQDPKQLIELKGIGPYTQGAILSIAFNKPAPAVDGNVMRVLSRVLHMTDNISEQKTRKKIEKIVNEIIEKDNPSAFNQGLMELGALICTPKSPACLHCPVRPVCRAFADGVVEQLPVRTKSKQQKRIAYNVLIIRDENNRIAIEQRPETGLLANLWQFPMLDRKGLEMNRYRENDYGIQLRLGKKRSEFSHIFSHIIWDLYVFEAEVANIDELNKHERIKMVPLNELKNFPFSVSHLKIMDLIKG